MEKIFSNPSARKRRIAILKETSGCDNRYQSAYRKCFFVYKNAKHSIIRQRAKADMVYFKRRIK